MTKLLVLYYSTYGHIETMAGAIAEGARSIEGVEVTVKRVPETLSPEAAAKMGAKLDQATESYKENKEEIAAKARQVRDEPMPDGSSIWKHVYAEDR